MAFYRSEFKAMGSPCDLHLYAESYAAAEHVAGTAIAEVRRLEALYSRFRSDSFLSAINRVAADGGSISVDEETSGLLNYAATCYRESDGLFDISSGILRRAWRFDRGELPDEAHVQDLLDKVGWHRVRWAPPASPRWMQEKPFCTAYCLPLNCLPTPTEIRSTSGEV